MLLKIIENREKEKAFELWLLELQHNKETPSNFDDYWKQSISNQSNSAKTKEEILQDVDDILNQFRSTL